MFQERFGRVYSVVKAVLIGGAYGALVYWSVMLFSIRIGQENGHMAVLSDIGEWCLSWNTHGIDVGMFIVPPETPFPSAFSKDEFYGSLTWSVPWLMIMGVGFFLAEVVGALSR